MVAITEIQDKYNKNKSYVISKSSCYHYYIKQYVCNRATSKRLRLSKKQIETIINQPLTLNN